MNQNRSAPTAAPNARPVRRSFLVRLTNYRGIAHPSAIRVYVARSGSTYFRGYPFAGIIDVMSGDTPIEA